MRAEGQVQRDAAEARVSHARDHAPPEVAVHEQAVHEQHRRALASLPVAERPARHGDLARLAELVEARHRSAQLNVLAVCDAGSYGGGLALLLRRALRL